jgi:hypothetical protein
MTNFSRHHTTKKGAYMSDREQTAKSTSKTVSHRTGIRAILSSLFRGSGSGASSRTRALLAVLALAIAAFAITAAPALAAPPATTTPVVSEVSYASAKVSGKLTGTPLCPEFCPISYSFQYSTSASGPWAPGPDGKFFEEVTDKPVDAVLDGLEDGTQYFVRLVAGNGFAISDPPEAISPGPNPSFTTLVADPASVEATDNASEVEYTTAEVSGTVNRPEKSNDLTCNFEYIADADYQANPPSERYLGSPPPVSCEQSPISTVGSSTVTAKLAGLAPSTIYHLRLAVSNAAGSDSKEAPATFTSLGPVPKPTVSATDDADEVSYFTAKASGEIQRPVGADSALDTSCRFEYVTEEQFTNNPPAEEFAGAGQVDCIEAPSYAPLTTTDPTPVSAELSGLNAGPTGTTYHLRLTAENGGGTTSQDASTTFTTLPSKEPALEINLVAPADIGYTTVHVSGTVDRGTPERNISYGWQVSSNPADWSELVHDICCSAQPGKQEYSENIGGLKPGTEYFARLIGFDVTNNEPPYPEILSSEPYESFTTKGTSAPPNAILDPVTNITGTTAHFSGTVDANAPLEALPPDAEAAYKTDWQIECTPACPSGPAFSGTVKAGEAAQPIAVDARHLDPNTEYTIRLVAHNSLESVESVQAFKTLVVPPTVKSSPGASDGQGGYTLQGVVNPNTHKVTSCKFEWGPNAPTYAFSAPCSPLPTGVSERQKVRVEATSGQFRLSFDGQTTNDIPFNAEASTVQAELESLSSIGASGVSGVTRTLEESTSPVRLYDVAFSGPLAERDLPQLQAENGTEPLVGNSGGGTVGVSTVTNGGTNTPITVEARLAGLTPDATYHALLVITYDAGTKADGGDHEFIPTLNPPQNCPNEQLRKENSSLALPECRAYEMVSPPNKSGSPANLFDYTEDGSSVAYSSTAGNIANSGAGFAFGNNTYATNRTAAGWETIPDLNGPTGSIYSGPGGLYDVKEFSGHVHSADLRSSLWFATPNGQPGTAEWSPILRNPAGAFVLIGAVLDGASVFPQAAFAGASNDLSHVVYNGRDDNGGSAPGSAFGPGVYQFVGTGNDLPERLDVDNSGNAISACQTGKGNRAAFGNAVSSDGRVVFLTTECDRELWARVGATTSYKVSASQCARSAVDPGGACNGPAEVGGCVITEPVQGGIVRTGCRDPHFQDAAKDGSRVFFTTTQQLVDDDADESNDLYACDIPASTPAPAGAANPCSPLRLVSAGDSTGAKVESVTRVSDDGSTAYFVAQGVLAANKDALGEKAVAGDHNLYAWRTDAAHPAGQTTFVARFDTNDVGGTLGNAQTTSDGQYLVFTTTSQLVATDTDSARDVYRYDADTEEMTRVSTNVFGVAGNADGLNARVFTEVGAFPNHHSHAAVSDDGSAVVFVTSESLSPLDGNGQPDVYLWKAARVSLISTGAVGTESRGSVGSSGVVAAIDGSGKNIYFNTVHQLTPSDGDDVADVYDARIGGGFSFAQNLCSGETCQPERTQPLVQKPLGSEKTGPANPKQPKPCPKGKARKHGKCVKKPHNHPGKKHRGKRAGHKQGGGK